MTFRCESLVAISPKERLVGQLTCRWKKPGLTQAANDLILTPGSLSEWFHMWGFLGVIVLEKSSCHHHGGIPPHHLSLAEGHPLHGSLVASLVLQNLLEHIVSEAVCLPDFFHGCLN